MTRGLHRLVEVACTACGSIVRRRVRAYRRPARFCSSACAGDHRRATGAMAGPRNPMHGRTWRRDRERCECGEPAPGGGACARCRVLDGCGPLQGALVVELCHAGAVEVSEVARTLGTSSRAALRGLKTLERSGRVRQEIEPGSPATWILTNPRTPAGRQQGAST